VLEQGFESHNELANDASVSSRAQKYSAWIVESSRFLNVPFGGFQPDKAGLNTTVDLPVNVGIIEGPDGTLTLYDTGWKQQEYLKMTGSDHWAPLPDQLKVLGFNAADVTKAVLRARSQRLGLFYDRRFDCQPAATDPTQYQPKFELSLITI